jgi:hypothetical protein
MDSDFKTPSNEPDKSEPADATKIPVIDKASAIEESQTTDVDSNELDGSKSDEPMVSDEKDSFDSMEDQPPIIDSAEHSETSVIQNESDDLKSDKSTGSSSSETMPVVTPPVKIQGAHKFIYGYIGLIVLVAVVVGIYVWQHSKVSKLDTQAATISAELSAEQNQVTSLKSQLAKADSAASSSTPAVLGLTVVKATRYTPSGTNSVKNSGIAVDVSIVNSTTKAVSLVTSDFKLKDALSNSYTATNFPTQTTDSSLPSGYTLLIDQSLAVNATVGGTLEFSVTNTSLTAFALVYNSQVIPFTVAAN